LYARGERVGVVRQLGARLGGQLVGGTAGAVLHDRAFLQVAGYRAETFADGVRPVAGRGVPLGLTPVIARGSGLVVEPRVAFGGAPADRADPPPDRGGHDDDQDEQDDQANPSATVTRLGIEARLQVVEPIVDLVRHLVEQRRLVPVVDRVVQLPAGQL